ncbi:MAG: hypothetical protein CMI56_02950, partial [Parcubacteria group bacterium]|nr:hypothetical protein [Parcubacteria group bacterium]
MEWLTKFLRSFLLFLLFADIPFTTAEISDVAIFSFVTEDFFKANEAAISSKECYCRLHGCTFFLEMISHDDPMLEGRAPQWARIPLMHKYLALHFEWVFYTDADTIITNSKVSLSNLIEDLLGKEEEKNGLEELPFLILQEGEEINSGGFLMRKSEESRNFLNRWWNMYSTVSKIPFLQPTQDQPALMLSLLAHALEERKKRERNDSNKYCPESKHLSQFVRDALSLCAAGRYPTTPRLSGRSFGGLGITLGTMSNSYWSFVTCWNIQMANINLPLFQRSKYGIYYHYRKREREGEHSTNIRGFNLVNALGDTDSAFNLHPLRIWQPLDLLVHVTSTAADSTVAERQSYFLSEWQDIIEKGGKCPGSHWTLFGRQCKKKPCVEHIWENMNRLHIIKNEPLLPKDEMPKLLEVGKIEFIKGSPSPVHSKEERLLRENAKAGIQAMFSSTRSAAAKKFIHENKWNGYISSVHLDSNSEGTDVKFLSERRVKLEMWLVSTLSSSKEIV